MSEGTEVWVGKPWEPDFIHGCDWKAGSSGVFTSMWMRSLIKLYTLLFPLFPHKILVRINAQKKVKTNIKSDFDLTHSIHLLYIFIENCPCPCSFLKTQSFKKYLHCKCTIPGVGSNQCRVKEMSRQKNLLVNNWLDGKGQWISFIFFLK